MRFLSLAAIITLVVIAACSDVASPIAAGSDVESLTDGGGAAHFLGGRHFDGWGKHHHDGDEERPECGGDGDRDHHHWTWRVHRRGGNDHRWGQRGTHFSSRGKHGFSAHKMGMDSPDVDDEDCGGEGGGGGGEPGATATIGGAVMNDGAAASGFPVFLLNPAGTTVLASTVTASDGTGSYSFAGLKPGTYLVCETDPFVELYGFLGQTRPATGPACPAGYGPVGFSITVVGGATAGGNDFSNFGEI